MQLLHLVNPDKCRIGLHHNTSLIEKRKYLPYFLEELNSCQYYQGLDGRRVREASSIGIV